MRLVDSTAASDETLQQIARAFDPARLVRARHLAKMTKAQLHEHVGVTASAVGQYERRRGPCDHHLRGVM